MKVRPYYYGTYILLSQSGPKLISRLTYIYEAMASGGEITLPVPGNPGNTSASEPLRGPHNLDGGPLRGWEAVATSYFLVNSADELHEGVPPHDLRLTYCLYDPYRPLND